MPFKLDQSMQGHGLALRQNPDPVSLCLSRQAGIGSLVRVAGQRQGGVGGK